MSGCVSAERPVTAVVPQAGVTETFKNTAHNHGNKGSLGIPNQSLQSAEAYVVLHVKCPLFFSGVKKSWSNWRCHERVELYLHNPFFMVLCSLSVGDFLDAFGPGKVPMVSSCEHLWVP
jgi:hypothetical protein